MGHSKEMQHPPLRTHAEIQWSDGFRKVMVTECLCNDPLCKRKLILYWDPEKELYQIDLFHSGKHFNTQAVILSKDQARILEKVLETVRKKGDLLVL